MSGIATILNIGKEALMAQQTAISVASHNIANADTEGYSRQSLTLTTATATSIGVGYLGNGVEQVSIMRQYDQFITHQIVDKNSTLGYLEAQTEAYPVLEAVFDETDELGVSDLLNAFWDSLQELSDNPELDSSRQDVIQQAQLLIDKLDTITESISELRADLGVSMKSAIDEVNSITKQIADLNKQISSTESENTQQNDLRDKRDTLISELSSYIDISCFQAGNGTYSVVMADGHTLVSGNQQWDLGYTGDTLNWISENATCVTTETAIKGGTDIGGKIGGISSILNQISEGDTDNYVGKLNTFANALIREINQQFSQGIGLTAFSDELVSANVANTAVLTTTIDAEQAGSSIAAGTLEINGISIGKIAGGTATYGLATKKTANMAEAINNAECGVSAKLTTQVSGAAISDGLAAGESINFTICGIDVSYTASANETSAETAANIVTAINDTINAYNADSTHTPKITLEADIGNETNGGAANSIILRNTNAGDESVIIIAGIDASDAAESKIGLSDGNYAADATYNTGTVSIFSTDDIEIKAGTNDLYLEQLGLGGGNISSDDIADDGKLTFRSSDNSISGVLQGFAYSDELQLDGGSFSLWLYNEDGSTAFSNSVTVDLTRCYTLQDVADAINTTLSNVNGINPAWLTATVEENRLVLTPDGEHEFAFASDTTNFLATSELNTFFTGSSATDIAINQTIADNPDYIAAGTVGEDGEILSGNNSNALLLVEISQKEDITFTGGKKASLNDFYTSLIGDIGLDSQDADDSLEYTTMIANQLIDLRDSASGVSLDEEMANLIKYQQAYNAAAKLITIADEMMQTLLETI